MLQQRTYQQPAGHYGMVQLPACRQGNRRTTRHEAREPHGHHLGNPVEGSVDSPHDKGHPAAALVQLCLLPGRVGEKPRRTLGIQGGVLDGKGNLPLPRKESGY